ncbi:hypothetical protein DRQ09_00155, partial [candidate division KSB1 bacterium]
QTGEISGTPQTPGVYTFTVEVQDSFGRIFSKDFSIEITEVNEPPVITDIQTDVNFKDTIYAGDVFSYQVQATDPNTGDVLVYKLQNEPAGMVIDSTTGLISWTPDITQLGQYTITVIVTDKGGLQDSDTFTIFVEEANLPPELSPVPDTTITAGELYNYQLKATDPNINAWLSYYLISAPENMSVNSETGLITWIPTEAQAGANIIMAGVDDGRGGKDSTSFTITVILPLDVTPPVITFGPIVEGIDTSSAYVKWSTDEEATSIVEFGLSSTWDDKNTRDSLVIIEFVKEHKVQLTDLMPDTSYNVRVKSVDSSGNVSSYSKTVSFKTMALPDVEPPVIVGNPQIFGLDTNKATIYWETNELASSIVIYSPNSLWSDITKRDTVKIDELVTIHYVTLEDLSPATTYKAVVASIDAKGNGPTTSKEFTFTTPELPDREPPIITRTPIAEGLDTSSVTIIWETNEISTSIVQYSIDSLFDEEGARFEIKDDNLVTFHRIVITGLLPATTYRVRTGSVDGAGNGPTWSGAISFRTLERPDNAPPVIVGFPEAVGIDTSHATIIWKTNEISNSIVIYAIDSLWSDPNMRTEVKKDELVIEHKVLLTGLESATTYRFIVGSIDGKGNGPAYSGEYTFKTMEKPDTEPPVITLQPQVEGIDTSHATVIWETDEYSTSIVEYAVDSLWNITTERKIVEDFNLVIKHNVFLIGLKPSTRYRFRVGSIDEMGNGPTYSNEYVFETPERPDVYPPIITQFPSIEGIDTSRVTIKWMTDEISNSIVEYALDSLFDISSERNIKVLSDLVTEHIVVLTDLLAGKKYRFRVGSIDGKGNGPTYSGEYAFETKEKPDTEPPIILGFPVIEGIDTSQATIKWKTNEISTSMVEYAIDSLWSKEENRKKIEKLDFVKEHSILLTDLIPDTEYRFRVGSVDANNNGPVYSGEYVFKTMEKPDLFPPLFTSLPSVQSKDTTRVTIVWSTNEPSNSVVEFAVDSLWNIAGKRKTKVIQTPVIDHIVILTDLSPNTLYRYTVSSTDMFNNGPTVSPEFTFKTLERPDLIPPVIIGFPNPVDVDTSSVTIKWKTNELSTSIVEYAPETDWPNNILTEIDQSLTTEHEIYITGLASNTVYKFRVGSVDSKNNGPTYSAVFEFKTAEIPDIIPPVIIGFPQVTSLDTNTATIEWKTNESSNSIVEYAESSTWPADIMKIIVQEFVTEHKVFLPDLKADTEYKFRVQSTDTKGNISDYSPEQVFKTLERPDNTPPVIIGFPSVINVDTNTATIAWKTDENATSTVIFGPDSSWPAEQNTVEDLSLVKIHEIMLTELTPDVKYRFKVSSIDAKNNGPTESGEFTFTTLALPDFNPPVIVGFPSVTNIDTSKATIEWKTNENSTSIIEYAEESEWLTNKITIQDQNLVIFHSILITNLKPATSYKYRVGSIDSKNNGPTYSVEMTFKTTERPDDIPPTIVGFPDVVGIDTDRVTIEWKTNETSNSIVEYALTGEWPGNKKKITEQDLVVDHSVLITGLLPDTEYTFIVGSVDASNNGPTYSKEQTFKTAALPDFNPPVIVGFPSVVNIDTDKATIEWKTDENSTSIVEFASENEWPSNKKEVIIQDLVTEHSVLLAELTPKTTYIFRVGSIDGKSNGPSYSGEHKFTTLEVPDLIPPAIVGFPSTFGVDTDRVTIEWKTNENATSIVEYALEDKWPNEKKEIIIQDLVTEHSIVVVDLTPSTKYKFRVGSVDANNNGPTYSGEHTFETAAVPDNEAPAIIGLPNVIGIDTNKATVEWKTNESATSIVEIAKETEWPSGIFTVKKQSLLIDHSILVSNLEPATTYKFRVGSIDGSGNGPTYSIEQTFTTLARPDFSPPAIVGFPSVAGIDTSSATVKWKTNEDATSIVEYAIDEEWNTNRKTITNQDLVIDHNILLANLSPDTTYRFRVGSIDSKSNGPTYSGEFTFKTLAIPDHNPPAIVGLPGATKIDTGSATIVWKTDEDGTSIVEFAPSSSWPADKKTVVDQNLVVDHNILITNLKSNTEYKFRVGSIDGKGNGPGYSKEETFTTLKAADKTPPALVGFPSWRNADTSSVTIEWQTNETSNSIVEICKSDFWPDSIRVFKIQDLVIEHSVFVSDLEPNTEYKFRVGSMDGEGNGPTVSGVFSFHTLERPDLEAPVIIGFPNAVDIDTNSAKIVWTTNENSTSIVEFAGIDEWNGNRTKVIIQDLVINHSVYIGNLKPNTKYRARVGSIDAKSNGPTYSSEFEFKTADVPDNTPPVIIGFPSVDDVDTNSANIIWVTDEEASSIVEFAIESEYSTEKIKIKDQRLVKTHKVYISNLKPGTVYKYRCGSVDARSNGPTWSNDYTFTTLEVADKIPPVIVGLPSEFGIDTTSLTIKWKTDERATSIVEIAPTSEWPQNKLTIVDQTLVTEHAVFISNLVPGTEYTYRVGSIDAKSNGPTYSENFTFKTLQAADTKAPVITESPIVIGLSHHQATIKWKTDETAYSSVDYGETTALGKTVTESKGKTTHTIKLTNLSEQTKYYFKIRSRDQTGNEFVGTIREFTTKAKPVLPDTIPPAIIEGPIDKDVKSDRATIKWRTDKESSSVVEYGLEETNLKLKKTQDAAIGVIEHIVNITNLEADTTYFYRVRSRSANNKEVVSRIFKFDTEAAPDTLPPVIVTGPIASFIETDKATIEWTTDKIASSIVYYGEDTSYGNIEKEDMLQGVKEHKITLTGLKAGTEYHYMIESKSENLKVVSAGDFIFITKVVPDTIPPKIISGPVPTSVEHNKATIEWETDELSNSFIEYDTTDALTQHQYSDLDASGVMKHKIILTNLVPNKEYKYRVSSSDLSPNLNKVISVVRTFKTLAAPDTIPPRLVRGPETSSTDRSATFEWETDELSDTYVYYNEKGSTEKPKRVGDEKKVLVHIITVTNLKKGVEYEFTLTSTDYAGNIFSWPNTGETKSIEKILAIRKTMQPPGGDGTFFTSQTVDTQKPIIIEGPKVLSKTTSTVTVYWKTDERSDSFVKYGKTTSYEGIKGEAADVFEHKITLTNLQPNTLYNFKVASTDVNDNGPTESANSVVTTESEADVTPPRITAGPVVESITDNQATIVWETDEPSDSRVEFGTDVNYGITKAKTENVTVHRITITNLSPNTEYHFKVFSTDIDNNGPSSSDDMKFKTEEAPDRTPPTISNIKVTATTDQTATIEWDTDELSDSFINYGFTSNYGYKVGSSQDVLHHKITITNLTPDTLYHFRVGSIDKSDNEAPIQADMTFRTAAARDTIPPAVPAGLEAIAGSEKVLLRWNKNTEGDLAGYDIYRKTGSDTSFSVIATLVADTFYLDVGLQNYVTYEYQIKAVDNVTPPNRSEATSPIQITPKMQNIPTAPEIYYPINGVRVSAKDPVLQIINSTKPPEREKLTYSFIVSEDSMFYQVVVFKEGIEEEQFGTTSWHIGQVLKHNKVYYWKSRAFDGIFYSSWMNISSFIADTTMATEVELAFFRGNDVRGTVELEWQTKVEKNISGFNIFRSFFKDKEFVQINKKIVKGNNGSYRMVDTDVEIGKTYYYRIEAVNIYGFETVSKTISVTVKPPRTFALKQNYPNPFNPTTTIKYDLPAGTKVQLKIFNMLGQEVKTLVNEYREAGYHKVIWDGRNNNGIRVASGVYIYAIKAGKYFKAKKMVLLR